MRKHTARMGNDLVQWRAAIRRSSRARTVGSERKLNYPYGASDCDPDDVTKAINKVKVLLSASLSLSIQFLYFQPSLATPTFFSTALFSEIDC